MNTKQKIITPTDKEKVNAVACFLFVLLISIPVFDNAFGDLWKIQIPPNASEVNFSTHFMPKQISINIGDSVEWGNTDAVGHTVTSGSLESGVDGKFYSNHLKSGEIFNQTFTNAGEFKYFCTIHPWMTGIINVFDLPEDFQIFHYVGGSDSEITFDVPYKVKRSLSTITIENSRDMITFHFVGKIDNDEFVVYLPQKLIKDPHSVWIGETQIDNFDSQSSVNGVTLTIPMEGSTTQVRIMGTDVIGEFSQKPYVLVNQIFAVTDKQTYYSKDTITISGIIKNPNQLSKITTEITSPNDVVLYYENTLIQDSGFTVDVSTDVLIDSGEYKIDFKGNDINSLAIYFDYEFQKQPSTNTEIGSEILQTDILIPAWIKNNASWWADGSISDGSFIYGIQYLIKEDVIDIPPTIQGSGSGSEIPAWIKNNASWWADGSISDGSFIYGIQYMIKIGIMRIS